MKHNNIIKSSEEVNEKLGTTRKSRVLHNQQLKREVVKVESLQPETRRALNTDGSISKGSTIAGLDLTAPQTKIIDILCEILDEKNTTNDPKSKDFYTGNSQPEFIEFEDSTTHTAPSLSVTLYEFTKRYYGPKKKLGGKDMSGVTKILAELASKYFLLQYKEIDYDEKTGVKSRELTRERYDKIIKFEGITEVTYSTSTGIEKSKTQDLIIVLHSIFRHGIHNNYVIYPKGIVERTRIAFGGPNRIPLHIIKLRDWLLEKLSHGNINPCIAVAKLLAIVNPKRMSKRRESKKALEEMKEAIGVCKRLNLLASYRTERAKTLTGDKITFEINKNFVRVPKT